VKDRPIAIARIVSVPFEENSYIARLEGHDDCVVVDPGLEPEKIIAHLDENRLAPAAILITHGHGDHIGGNAALRRRWPQARIAIGRADAEKLLDARLNLSATFGAAWVSPPADQLLQQGDVVSAAGLDLEVLAIPGHSTGHVVYLWRAGDPPLAFVGDVIFLGGIGRTDFPGGSFEQLVEGIRAKLFTLPDDTVLLPGHGPSTTVGREKRSNPFLQ
jgi:glyoxylase-like metal-dependent hydrolase (beta-lactamase superfamily II)